MRSCSQRSICTQVAASCLGGTLLLGVQPRRSRSHFGQEDLPKERFSFCTPRRCITYTGGKSREASESETFPLTKRAGDQSQHRPGLQGWKNVYKSLLFPAQAWSQRDLRANPALILACYMIWGRPSNSLSLSLPTWKMGTMIILLGLW